MSFTEKYRRYPAYKDSGVQWIGEIPTHWEVRRLKHVATWNDEALPDSTDAGLEMTYVDIGGVDAVRGIVEKETLTFQTAPSRAKRIVRHGDVVISTVRTYLRAISSIIEPEASLIVSTGFAVIRPRLIDTAFASYAMRAPYFVDHVVANSVGVSYPAINANELVSIAVVYPSEREQRAIAVFLDRETAKIDALVAKKERLIELLQEKRTALITQAVTKGLDPAVQTRDSGFEWLGEIPEHWELKRTKYRARLESGHTPSRQNPEYWQDCQIPWFTLADVWQIREGGKDYVTDTQERVSELGLAHSSARLLPKGTVILSRTASVGFSAILGVNMATSQDYVNWVCHRDLQPEYLLYVFRSMEQEFQRLTMGSTHRTIYMPDVGQFSAPLPPIEEQREIVEFVRLETSKTDTLLSKVHNAIERLKELRTALISAAVTGKIDVRDDAGSNPRTAP